MYPGNKGARWCLQLVAPLMESRFNILKEIPPGGSVQVTAESAIGGFALPDREALENVRDVAPLYLRASESRPTARELSFS